MADQRQLDIEQQINKAIAERAALLDRQQAMIADQIALAQELCRAMECQELDGYNERIKETREGLLNARDATDQTTDSNQNLEKQLKKSSKSFSFFKGAAVGAAVAVKNAFGMVFGVVKSLVGFVKTAVTGAFKIVKFLISGWSKMLGELAQKGMEAANAGIALRNAYENVKFTFGGLASKEGKSVTGVFDKMRSNMGNVAGTGVRFSKIFGKGPEGLAAGLEYITEIAEGMGPSFERMAEGFEEAADEIVVLGRSLGFAGEDFATLGTMAGYAGESMKETLGRLQREIVTTSKNLGVNSKAMADNIKIMMKSPLVFGTTTKEMIKTSVAAQKLGVSIEQLQGPMSVFDDFESAAQNAADLAAEFGVMVDATEMMSADPADQFTMLKDAIEASGKSFEDMSRQERKRLAELSGMDPEALFKAMDPSNAFDNDALDAADSAVDAATKSTLSQAKATQQLTKQMKKLHETMDPMNTGKGFIGTFFQGMQEGLMRSKEGRAMLKGVTDAFREVLMAGREVGGMLAELFRPGAPLHFLYEYFTELPNRMRAMMVDVKAAFRQFVTDLNAGGDQATHAMANLVGNLKDAIFGQDSAFMGAMIDGFHFLIDLIVANLINMVPYVLEGLITLFEGAIALMSGESLDFAMGLEEGTLMPMTRTAFAALMSDDVVTRFGDAFMDMMRKFWEVYGKDIIDFMSKILIAIVTAALLKSVIPIIASGVLFKFGSALMSGVGAAVKRLTGIPDPTGGAGGAPGQQQNDSFVKKLKDTIECIASIDGDDIKKAAKNLFLIGGTLAVGILGLGGLALALSAMGVDPVMMGVVALTTYALAKVTEAIAAVVTAARLLPDDKKVMGKAAIMIVAATAVFAAVIGLSVMAIESLAAVQTEDPIGLGIMATAAGAIAMVGLTVTAGIVGLGAVMGVIAALASNPFTMGLMLAGIAAAALVFSGAMSLATSVVMDLATVPTASAEAAKAGAEAAGMVVDTSIKVINLIWEIMKTVVWDKDSFDAIFEDIEQVIHSINCKLVPQITAASKMFTEDPAVVRAKMEIIVMLIDSFAPITNMMTSALQIKNANPEQIAMVVKQVGDGMKSIFQNVSTMIQDIVRSTTTLTESQMAAAEVAGPLLQSVATLMSSLMPAASMFEDNREDIMGVYQTVEAGWVGDDAYGVKKTGSRITKTARAKQIEFVQTLVDLLTKIKDPMKNLVTAIATIKIPGDPEEIKKNMGVVSSIMEAVGSVGRGIMDNVGAVKEISGKGGKDALASIDVGQLAVFFLDLRILLVGETGRTGLLAQAAILSDHVAPYADVFTKRRLDGMERTITGVNRLVSMLSTASPLAGLVEESSKTFESLNNMDAWTNAVVQPLVDMVNAFDYLYKQTNNTLENLPALNAVLNRVGEKLQITDQKLTVTTDAINLSINLNVKLDAKDIARALVEGEYVPDGPALRSRLDLPAKNQ